MARLRSSCASSPSPTPSPLPYLIGNSVSVSRTGLRKTTRDQTTASLKKSTLNLNASKRLPQGLTPTIFDELKDDELDSPFIYPLELDSEQLRNWDMFKLQVKDVKVVRGLRYRLSGDAGGDFGEDIEPHADICISLAKFAVDTFNKSYQHFVEKKIVTAIVLTNCLECFYYKLTSRYYFFMKLNAIEQGISGVYEVVVRCDHANGARTLSMFRFARGPMSERIIPASLQSETKEDVPLVPVDLYEASGMLRRGFTKGHDFYNPICIKRVNLYGGAKQNLEVLMRYKYV
ncbi:hypothetical protein Tco_0682440 [Tanacetum coccineum]|uniref:Uncharacterized protein n=1 Tax=Tanacetum coccineum TaxID=301880 RepID=A0ABQ4XR55_9ASTR